METSPGFVPLSTGIRCRQEKKYRLITYLGAERLGQAAGPEKMVVAEFAPMAANGSWVSQRKDRNNLGPQLR